MSAEERHVPAPNGAVAIYSVIQLRKEGDRHGHV